MSIKKCPVAVEGLRKELGIAHVFGEPKSFFQEKSETVG
jgi:hypothetical protein